MLFGALLLWLALWILRIGLQTHGLHSNDTNSAAVQPLLRHVLQTFADGLMPPDAQRHRVQPCAASAEGLQQDSCSLQTIISSALSLVGAARAPTPWSL